jgi:hypothetical protein
MEAAPAKFGEDSHMSYQEVFNFALHYQARILTALAAHYGREEFMQTLTAIALADAEQSGRQRAAASSKNDVTTFAAPLVNPGAFWSHTLTYEIVENSERAFEVRVTECLWADTCRRLGGVAAELGYALTCNPDFGACRGFNPKLRMERSKTLMQGDDCCNHRWTLEE